MSDDTKVKPLECSIHGIKLAKMEKDIEFIKITQREEKIENKDFRDDHKKLHEDLKKDIKDFITATNDSLLAMNTKVDDKASEKVVNRLELRQWQIIAGGALTAVSIIGFLIKYIWFK